MFGKYRNDYDTAYILKQCNTNMERSKQILIENKIKI